MLFFICSFVLFVRYLFSDLDLQWSPFVVEFWYQETSVEESHRCLID